MSGIVFLMIGFAAGAFVHAGVSMWRRRGSEGVVGSDALPADASHVIDLLRRVHGAVAACIVMPDADPVWSTSDPPPPTPVLDRAVVAAMRALGDGRDHVLSGDETIIAAGDGRMAGAVLFQGSDVEPSVVEGVTLDLRTTLADCYADRAWGRGRLVFDDSLSTPTPQWLVPESVEAVGFALCEAAHNLTGRPAAVVVRDPITQIASVVAVSAGADRRLLRTTVAPSSAAGRASMGDITATARGMKDLFGGTGENRRMRERRGAAFSLVNGRPGVGALVVFGLPETAPSPLIDRILSLARDAGPVVRRAATVRASEQRALVDQITGQPNRHALERAMKEHDDGPCSLLCLNIDQFDQLRETARSAALRHVSSVFRSTLRDYDVAARLRDEAFAIFLPDTPFHHAFTVADRVRTAISESVFNPGGARWALTCSLGVASVPETSQSVDGLVTSADRALALVKSQGRNQVAAAPSPG